MKRVSRPRSRAKRKRLDGPIHGRIKELREAKGWTQEQLSDAVGVDNTAVSHWETGFAGPDISRLAVLAKALDTTVEKLIEGDRRYRAVLSLLEAA